jgi:hypothetical protein
MLKKRYDEASTFSPSAPLNNFAILIRYDGAVIKP